MPSIPKQHLQATIDALEAQRDLLGHGVVDVSVASLRAQLAELDVAASVEPAQTLKQVTILYMDLADPTVLARGLDAAAAGAVVDDLLRRGTAIVQAHGSRVLQYAGDKILAAFGVSEVREDDVERAVHCGLALLELGRAVGASVQATHGVAGLDVRAGLHTGDVLLGGGVEADNTIRGSAVNIAARMGQTAPARALRISDESQARVRGLFELEAQPPLKVKGIDAPMQTWLVRGARPRSFRNGARGIEGVATRMIGRDAELAVLQQAFERLHRERTLAVVTVVGDAGIGKSRLLYEFEAWSEARPERFVRFRGRATPQAVNQPYGLLRDILAWRFQIADDDSLATARAKLEQGVAPLFVTDLGPDLAQAQAHLLGHLVGIDWKDSPHLRGILEDARQIRNRAFHATAQLLRRIGAGTGPVVLLLEDLHWADGESLAFLDYLVDRDRDVPLLVLASTRATLYERWNSWAGDGEQHRRVDLRRLDEGASGALVDELLQKLRAIPEALRALLTGRAEGNPFYMEELVKMLVDQGAIRTGDPWQVDAERLIVAKVPPTITGVLQARLDTLPGEERLALQQASVVGAVFWDRALAAVDERAVGQLPALARRELALPRPDAPALGLREYAFHHHTLHQVTYETVLKRPKREGHAKVGRWLADQVARGGVRSGDLLGVAAEHFERAGDAPHAVDFHVRAAEHALGRLAHESVLTHVGRALALLPAALQPGDGPATLQLRWRLLSARGRTLFLQARRDELTADLAGLAEVADALDDDGRRAEVAYRRGVVLHRLCDWRAMATAAGEGAACAERAGNEPLRWRAMNQLAIARLFLGEVEPARELAATCLVAARRLGLHDLEPHVLNTLGNAAAIQHDLIAANAYCRQSLQLCREAGDRINEGIAQSNLGVSLLLLGDLAQARHDLQEALLIVRANGDRAMEVAALQRLSGLALWEGDAARSRELARTALDTALAARAREFEAFALLRLGQAEAALGCAAAAREAFERARSVGQEIGLEVRRDAIAGLATVALAEGDVAGAVEALQPLLVHLDAGGTWDGTEDDVRLIELTLCRVLARAGDPRAGDALARAHASLMAEADGIRDDALKESFLGNIPHHREIVAAWAGRDGPGARASSGQR